MFETITFNQPYEYGKWASALKSKLWSLQLLYGEKWRRVDVSEIGGST